MKKETFKSKFNQLRKEVIEELKQKVNNTDMKRISVVDDNVYCVITINKSGKLCSNRVNIENSNDFNFLLTLAKNIID